MSNDTVEDASRFECCICFEIAKHPIITHCGHLYCWPCLHQWFESQQGTKACPTCKADLQGNKIIPVYCRDSGGPNPTGSQTSIPPRPRPPPLPEVTSSSPNPWSRGVPLPFENQPGALWTVLGISGGPQGAGMTPEQQHQAFLTRLLLLLGSFVILCLLLF
eukprot:g5715.t1